VLGGVLAVDVEEADGAAEGGGEPPRRQQPAVAPAHDDAAGLHPVGGEVRLEAPAHAGVGPGEVVDRQRPLALGEGERHGDEQPALEDPDLGDVAADARGGLPREQRDDDARRERRGHPPDGEVAVLEVAVGGRGHGHDWDL